MHCRTALTLLTTLLVAGPLAAQAEPARHVVEGARSRALAARERLGLDARHDFGIRRAVKELSDRGALMKVYGGVMAATPLPPLPAAPGDAGAISQIAASLVEDGDFIFLDEGPLVAQIVRIFEIYGYKTQVLAASIRHTRHIIDCMEAGAHVVTCPLKPILGLLDHPLTDKGLAKFVEDAKKMM